jgi:uncharacterized NAD-dependent epimerase/dehydratase family protein
MIQTPYLLFLGDAPDQLAAKVAQGIRDWRPDNAVGQFRMEGCKADVKLPDMDLAEAKAAGAKTLVIGVANRGGVISPAWKKVLVTALEEGFDLASGLHNLLRDEEDLAAVAHATGRKLHDVRVPSVKYPIANGVPRTGKRCLAVGTDCSVGKMYTSLAMDLEMKKRGRKSSFRATGQTGILITGNGVPLDAVIADFMAGSIEWLTPDNDDDHWDMIEGQGSLFHVSYSGVTMALIHGGAPDALILSHEPTRQHMRGLPGYAMPSLEALRDLALPIARIANPKAEFVGISVNTAAWGEDQAMTYLEGVEKRMGLPAVDPFRQGAGRLVRRAGRVVISVTRDTFRLAQAFTISRGSRTEAQVLTVRVMREGVTGIGECVPYARYGETLDSVAARIEGLPEGISRQDLQDALPPGAARNAVDCAMWDWKAKRDGTPVHRLAGLPEPQPVVTAFTLSLDTPDNMRAAARRTHIVRF